MGMHERAHSVGGLEVAAALLLQPLTGTEALAERQEEDR